MIIFRWYRWLNRFIGNRTFVKIGSDGIGDYLIIRGLDQSKKVENLALSLGFREEGVKKSQ